MNPAVVVLCLCAFALLGSLPFTFFRSGRTTPGWWLTATPFFADAALLIAALAGMLTPVRTPPPWAAALTMAAVPLVAAAIGLIGCTIGVHRAPVSMWHQDADTPSGLVTTGPYARIRHPFYAAFILMLIGTAAALPHPGTLLLLCIGTLQLHRTARREERRLLNSPLATAYAAYMARTGRFLPRRVRPTTDYRPAPTGSRYSTAPANSPASIPRSGRD